MAGDVNERAAPRDEATETVMRELLNAHSAGLRIEGVPKVRAVTVYNSTSDKTTVRIDITYDRA